MGEYLGDRELTFGLRAREASDLPVLADILARQQASSRYPFRWPLPMPDVDFVARSSDENAWVAHEGPRLLGHVAVGIVSEDDFGEIFRDGLGIEVDRLRSVTTLFTSIEARSLGVGRALLAHAEADIVDRGLVPVLDVLPVHAAASAMYARRGWRTVTTATAVDAIKGRFHVEHIAPEGSIAAQIDDLRPAARRRYWLRQVLNAAVLPGFAAVLVLTQTFDLTFFVVACLIGALNFFMAMSQRRPILGGHRDGLVPLVLGLDFRRRRTVRRAVRTANPSVDPVLQYVELTEARRLALQYKTSVWALGVSLVVLLILAAVHFADGSNATVFVLAALAVFAVVAGTWSMLSSRGAQRYLERLGYDPQSLLPRDEPSSAL